MPEPTAALRDAIFLNREHPSFSERHWHVSNDETIQLDGKGRCRQNATFLYSLQHLVRFLKYIVDTSLPLILRVHHLLRLRSLDPSYSLLGLSLLCICGCARLSVVVS